MEKTDARKLSPDVQHEFRKQAIRMRKRGQKYHEIAETLGVNPSTVYKWNRKYRDGGLEAISKKKRGRRLGECRTLTLDQENDIRQIIKDRCPDQMKLPFALWTRVAVKMLIKHLWGIEMPIRTIGEYLNRWGYTPQKPKRRAYEQNPQAVKRWLDDEYPKIAKQAKKEKAEIHWGDETGLCNDSNHGRSYAPRGKTPTIRLPAKKERINLISTITNQGKVRFMIYQDMFNTQVMIRFLERLIKDARQKIYLILDNLRVHHSKDVQLWLKKHKKSILVFFLPSYSPELNPDEYLNCDLKAGVHSRVPARTKKQLVKKTISHLRMLQKKPHRVAKYFENSHIAYAS